jgi:phosphate-selective porin OprO and OprP
MLALLLLLLQDPPREPAGPPPLEFRGGLLTANQDGSVRWRINGRVMYDWGAFDPDLEPAVASNSEFRRVRLLAKGLIGEHFGARFQWDFSDSTGDLLEGMFDWRTFPLGTLRVGHFREPFGLEARTSSAYLTFLERSTPSDAFTPGRNRGVQLRDRGRRWSWALGLFRAADEPFPGGPDRQTSVTLRTTWLPWREPDDRRLLHLGLALSWRDPRGAGLRLRARPAVHLVDPLVDTGLLPANSAVLAGFEGALIEGPFQAQAELFLGDIDLPGEDGRLWGASLAGSWFLTGDHRVYRDSTSSLGKVRVERSRGAWEVALRYSTTDLSDGDVDGGELEDWSLGLNWHITDSSRVMLGYGVNDLRNSNLDGDALLLRVYLGF